MSKQKKKKGPSRKAPKKARNPIARDLMESGVFKPQRIPNKKKYNRKKKQDDWN